MITPPKGDSSKRSYAVTRQIDASMSAFPFRLMMLAREKDTVLDLLS